MLNIEELKNNFYELIYEEYIYDVEELADNWQITYTDYAVNGQTLFASISEIKEDAKQLLTNGLKIIFEKLYDDQNIAIDSFQSDMNSLFAAFWLTPSNIVFAPNPITTIVVSAGSFNFQSLKNKYIDSKQEGINLLSQIFDSYTRTVQISDSSIPQTGYLT